MKLASLLHLGLLGSACARVLSFDQDEQTLDKRQSQQTLITTGIPGTVYPRLEIRELKSTRPNQYTLLVIALNRWMRLAQSQYNGYFAISSIHGVPQDPYNNVATCGSACSSADGYGVHDSVLFPTWHRIYLATFEQELIKVAQQVANEYPTAQRSTMVAAANQLRWPYYDSAIRPQNGRPAFPAIMTDATVTVTGPTGKITFTNPLFRFDFQDSSGLKYSPFTTWKRTYRYPNSNGVNAASNTAAVTSALANIRQNLADQVYGLFSTCHDYLHFSNDRAGSSSASCATSIEDIHNTIHTAIGGGGDDSTGLTGGHMTYLPLSSYDPAFWLHHANVDRLFAMWQTINPNSWVVNQIAPTTSWTIAQGSTQGASSGLRPFFRQSTSQFWTSDQVRDWTALGYTYSDFTLTDGSAGAINSRINSLYGPGATGVASKRDTEPVDAASNQTDPSAEPKAVLLSDPVTLQNGSTFQYVANIFTPRYTLNGSYNVFIFHGPPANDVDPRTWITDSNLIGMMGVLSKPDMANNPLIASGSVPLTRVLQQAIGSRSSAGVLTDLSQIHVVPYLSEKLQWRVQGPSGQKVDPGTIDGFVIAVFASTAAPHRDDELPTFSPFVNLLEVTKQQSGGANTTREVQSPQQFVSAFIQASTTSSSTSSSTFSLSSTVSATFPFS